MCFCQTMTSSASALPDDVDTLKAIVVAMVSDKAELQAETAELKAEIVRLATVNERAEIRIADLHAIIKRLERAQFGRSSEKLDADQEAFAFDEVQTGLGAIEAELEAAKPASEHRRPARPRKAFPVHLERVEIVVEPENIDRGCDPSTRCAARQERSAAIVAELWTFWERELARIPGKSKLAEAIRYARSRRKALERFLHDGRLDIDSNAVERAIRPQTITRKNALFAGSNGGGQTWATIATLLQTAKMNGVDPFAWLTQTLQRIAAGWPNRDLDQLLPWHHHRAN